MFFENFSFIPIFAMMIDLGEHIRYLLRKHDCVIVPNLGAFIAKYRGSHIDGSRRILMPPVREIEFNENLRHDDNLLLNSVIRRNHYSRIIASEALSAAVEAVKIRLDAGLKVTFISIGTISQTNDGLTFTSDSNSSQNFYRYLPVLTVAPISRISAQTSEDNTGKATPVFNPTDHYRTNYWIKIAAILAIIITFGIAFLSGSSERGFITPNLASIGLTHSAPSLRPLQQELYIALPDKEESKAEIIPEYLSIDEYCLVIASLTSRKDAQRFISSQKIKKLQILESEGRYRVYIATGATKESLQAAQSYYAQFFQGAWICKMR